MQTIFLEPRDVPECIRRVFGGHRKYKAVITTEVSMFDNHWSGGSRTYYRGVDLATGKIYEPSIPECGTPFTPDAPTVVLEPGKAIVTHSIFQGKDTGITIYLHPENINKLVTADTPTLSEDEEIVLQYTRCRKSSYGGISNYRFYSASQEQGITIARWESAKASLIHKGLLNKAGAITVKGKNTKTELKVY